jgi:hypothetical protein
MKNLRILLPVIALAAAPAASAAIVYSGVQNIPIPYTFEGVYLNLVTGQTIISEPSDFYGAPSSAWINLDFAGVDIVNGDGLTVLVQNLDQAVNLPFGGAIDGTGNFASGPSASTNHLGATFQAETRGYIGFRMNPTGGGAQYGWIQVSLNDDSSGGMIINYGYEDVIGASIGAGVPEPGTGLLAALALGTLFRRRR